MIDKLIDEFGERRRDFIWFFIIGALFLGYAWAIMAGGIFALDASYTIAVVTGITTIALGSISFVIGIILLFCGFGVLLRGSEQTTKASKLCCID